MDNACFFIGHRDSPEDIYPLLVTETERHIAEYGVTRFIVGCRGSFDRLAARAVTEAKQRHHDVILTMLLPYHPSTHPAEIPDIFDDTLYPSGMESVPPRYAIYRANRYMVDHVGHLICYAWQPGSNALRLVQYARKRTKNRSIIITDIAHVPNSSIPGPRHN